MNKLKSVKFEIPAKLHTELKSRLLFDGVPMTRFIRYVVLSYLENNKNMVALMQEYQESNKIYNKSRRLKTLKKIKKGNEILKKFNLTKEEVDDLYSIIEGTNTYEGL